MRARDVDGGGLQFGQEHLVVVGVPQVGCEPGPVGEPGRPTDDLDTVGGFEMVDLSLGNPDRCSGRKEGSAAGNIGQWRG